jgi:hypothetical protein
MGRDMKIKLLAMVACMLISAQFAHAETKSDAEAAKLKAAVALTAAQKTSENATPAAEANPARDQKNPDTTATTKEKAVIINKWDKDRGAEKDTPKGSVVIKPKDKNKEKEKEKEKENKLDPKIEAQINQQIQEDNKNNKYKTTYSPNGNDVVITYQNDGSSRYSPSRKNQKNRNNGQTFEDFHPNRNSGNSTVLSRTNSNSNNFTVFSETNSEAPAEPDPRYADDKKFTDGWLANAGNEFTAANPFKMARIKFVPGGIRNDRWDFYPEADRMMLENAKKKASMNINTAWHSAELKSLDEMTKYPVLFITANGGFNPSASDLANLKKYLLQGGFVYADDCIDDLKGDGFFRSFKATIERAFGKMNKLPDSHAIYHCFNDLPDGAPHPHPKSQKHGGWGLSMNGRLVIFLTSGDIHCAHESRLMRLNGTNPMFSYDDETQALNMGMNIIIYALSHAQPPAASVPQTASKENQKNELLKGIGEKQ